jgi:hypothetical protein
MPNVTILSRAEVLAAVSGEFDRTHVRQIHAEDMPSFELSRGKYAAVWDEADESPLPVGILTTADDRREVVSWLSAYVSTPKPLTGHIRIEVAEPMTLRMQFGKTIPIPSRRVASLVGGILGELTASLGVEHSLDRAAAARCMHFNSFAVARVLLLGGDVSAMQVALRHAESARRITGMEIGSRSASAAMSAFSCLTGFSPRQSSNDLFTPSAVTEAEHISALLEDIQERGHVSNSTWANLVGRSQSVDRPSENPTEAIETRVRNLQRLIPTIEALPIGPLSKAVVAAYSCAGIDEHAAEHYVLGRLFPQRCAEVMIWYGVIAGLRNPDAVRRHASGLGYQVERLLKVAEPPSARPQADVAIAELETMHAVSGDVRGFRTLFPGYLTVELLPRIPILISQRVDQSEVGRQPGVANSLREHASDLLRLADTLDTGGSLVKGGKKRGKGSRRDHSD